MVRCENNKRTGRDGLSRGIHRLESLQVGASIENSQQCEQSVVGFDKTAALAVSILYQLGDYLSSDTVRVYEYTPIDLIAFTSARIAEITRMKEDDEIRHINVLLHPFSSIKDVEEILFEKV